MPSPSQAPVKKKPPDNIVAQILLGEGASEGVEGLQFIRDVMVNRARKAGKSLEAIATAPAQFSASARPDLEEFFLRQPLVLQRLAQELVLEAQRPDFTPKYPGIEFYVTQDLFANRDEFVPSHWLHNMEPAFTIGRHVALKPRPRR